MCLRVRPGFFISSQTFVKGKCLSYIKLSPTNGTRRHEYSRKLSRRNLFGRQLGLVWDERQKLAWPCNCPKIKPVLRRQCRHIHRNSSLIKFRAAVTAAAVLQEWCNWVLVCTAGISLFYYGSFSTPEYDRMFFRIDGPNVQRRGFLSAYAKHTCDGKAYLTAVCVTLASRELPEYEI